jgi:hypothetical protein
MNTHLKEIYDVYKISLGSSDLIDLHKGRLSNESFIKVYFKILEKINLLLLTA